MILCVSDEHSKGHGRGRVDSKQANVNRLARVIELAAGLVVDNNHSHLSVVLIAHA